MKKLVRNKSKRTVLLPDYQARSVKDIDFAELKRAGITHVAVDIDGTLVQAGSLNRAVDGYINHLVSAKKANHIKKIVVATNRLPLIARSAQQWFDLDGLVTGSLLVRKPSKKYYKRLLDTLGAKPSQTVMIGDRLLQDIYGANRVGMWTVLVDDLGREPWYDLIRLHRWRQNRRLRSMLEDVSKK